MSEFIRVRSAAATDPQHEFHASAAEVEAHPDLYEVIDPEIVESPEPPVYVLPSEPGKKPASGSKNAGKQAAKPVDPAPIKPVGNNEQEND